MSEVSSPASHSAMSLLDELLHLGGRKEGWNYCVTCLEKKPELLNFQLCEHRMCSTCIGDQSKTSPLPCSACGVTSTLHEPSQRFLKIVSNLNETLREQLDINFKNKTGKTDSVGHTTQRRGRKSSRMHGKRNAKGETELQLACIARDLTKVKELIHAGADVNAQDNTGWTSLHESAIFGYDEIAAVLLEAGALVDVPGEMNTTPLHDAVSNNQPKVAKLLLSYGANAAARNSKGQRPIDLAATDDMKALILNTSKSPLAQSSSRKKLTASTVWDSTSVLLMAAGNHKALELQLRTFAQQFKLKISNSFSEKVTHVVVMAKDGVCNVSYHILQAILGGKTIVSDMWVAKCLEAAQLLDPLPFEVKGTKKFPSSSAPERARSNATLKSPGLFNGCNIFLRHPTGKYVAEELALTKDGCAQLIKLGGGKVLTREPNADEENETNVPFHAASNGPLAKCCRYIIRWDVDGKIQYNMEHVKTLRVEWLVESIENFGLLDSSGYL